MVIFQGRLVCYQHSFGKSSHWSLSDSNSSLKHTMKESEKQDPLGFCIKEYFQTGVDKPMRSWIDEVEEPLLYPSAFFRTEKDMSDLERAALAYSQGSVLDVGAGAGCHSVLLQASGVSVTSLESSKYSCDVLKKRGLAEVVNVDIMEFSRRKFDTILLLMNGFGIAGTEKSLPGFLSHLKSLLHEGGSILGESTDIFYIHQTEQGVADIDLTRGYYGEVEFKVRYGSLETKFPWIYPDEYLLEETAKSVGLGFEVLTRGDRYNFLCRLTV